MGRKRAAVEKAGAKPAPDPTQPTGANGKDLDFGAGVRYKHFGADYAASLHRFFAADDKAFPDDTELDVTHLVSLGLSW